MPVPLSPSQLPIEAVKGSLRGPCFWLCSSPAEGKLWLHSAAQQLPGQRGWHPVGERKAAAELFNMKPLSNRRHVPSLQSQDEVSSFGLAKLAYQLLYLVSQFKHQVRVRGPQTVEFEGRLLVKLKDCKRTKKKNH